MDELKSQSFDGITLSPERRRFMRYSIRAQVELHVADSDVPLRLETTDLSRNGCYVENNMPLSIGTKVEAKLWLEGVRIVARGRVVTSHPQYGNCIMFLDYDADGEQRLRAFLDAIDLQAGEDTPRSQ